MNLRQRMKIKESITKKLGSIKASTAKLQDLKRSISTKALSRNSLEEDTSQDDTPSKPHSPKNVFASLDIGTEYVKALISESDGEEIKVIGVSKKHQGLTDMYAGAIADISAVVDNCDEALAEAENMAGVGVNKAVLGIAGELVRGITFTVSYKRSNSEKQITAEEMQLVIEKAQAQSKLKASKQLSAETGEKDIDVKLINSAIVAMFVDGYKISNPIGFQGSKLSIRLYSAFAPMVHIGALQQVASQLDLELMAIAAEPFAVSRTVVGTDPASSVSAILIDVGGGTTDIAFVEEGGVQGTRSFGIGGRSFTKAISEDLGISFKKAEQLKLNLSSDEYSVHERGAATKALQKTVEVWLSGVELSIAEFVEEQGPEYGALPAVIMLCGGGSSLSMLPKALHSSEGEWYKDLPFTLKPRIGLIKADAAKGITDTTDKVSDHTFITALGLLRVGQDTTGPETEESESKLKNSVESFKRVLRT
jgi:cell division protein FtsA